MSRKRQPAAFDPGDSECAASDVQYPSALFDSVNALDAWTSPTKAAKKYNQPLKRRKTYRRSKSSNIEDVEECGGDDDEPGSSSLPSFPDVDLGDPINSEPLPPMDTDIIENVQLTAYAEMVDASLAVFQHIGEGIFVVQGWDARRKQTTVRDTEPLCST